MPDIYISPTNTTPNTKPPEVAKPESPVSNTSSETTKNQNLPPLKNDRLLKKIAQKISIGHALASFAAYPKGVRFETQEDQEEIVLLLRRHPITNFVWVFIALVLFFIPIVFIPFLPVLTPLKIPLNFQIVGLIIWYSVIASAIFINFLVWYFNVYIVTDQRIIDVDFYNLTYKKIASASLDNIEDITIRAGGIIKVIFDFAHIDIQTAGTVTNFTFEDVPHPDIVARQIDGLADIYKLKFNHEH